MGRNAAFGRPKGHQRLRLWWLARSQAFRHNTLLAVAVGVVVVALIMMATSRDSARTKAPNAAGPHLTVLQPLSTVVVGDLRAAGAPATPTDGSVPGSTSSTTTSTVAVAATVRATTPTTPATVTRSSTPAAPVPASDGLSTEVPAPTTTPPVVITPPTTAAPTAPPSTTTPSTAPPTTQPTQSTMPPTTALPAIPLPLGLPPLLGPG